ncbi:MAG: single-stranded DNA-binding protein [Acidimicrobiales bacterium]
MLNLVVLEGVLARPAEQRELPSGTRLVSLEVTVRREQGPAETAPVAWFDAPAWAAMLDADAAVLVVGRVRRRFYRAEGTTRSRTEVVASRVVRRSSLKAARGALGEACAALEAAALAPAPPRG